MKSKVWINELLSDV